MSARERIEALLSENPDLTARELATLAGITHQRVYQIAKSAGIKLRDGRIRVGLMARNTDTECRSPKIWSKPAQAHVAGRVSELMVAADLTARGWCVFLPVAHNSHLDLVATSRDGKMVARVEVKCGKFVDGNLRYNPKQQSAADHVAIVVMDHEIIYRPALPGLP